jgi:transketolase
LLSYRQRGSRFEGHPVPVLPWVEVATGSLGQGLPIGVGIALAGKRLDRLPYRVWVLTGDGELAEGSMWEAIERAGVEALDNLVVVVDVNRLGQTGPTMHGWDLDAYIRRFEAAGWRAIAIDGHDIAAIDDAYTQAIATTGRPTAIVARTVKGSGAASVEVRTGAHGKALDDAAGALAELGADSLERVAVGVRAPDGDGVPHRFASGPPDLPRYEWARNRRHGAPMPKRWSRSVTLAGTWSRSMARSATRPTWSCSRPPSRGGTSRCTSRSS